MPRVVELAGDRLSLHPAINREPDHVGRLVPGERIAISRGGGTLEVAASDRGLSVRRHASGLPGFKRHAAMPAVRSMEAHLFVDGPLIELFWNDLTVTAILPGEGPIRIAKG